MKRMNIVITGHVDHGKSTLTGRLLADTGSLPEGKLEAVKAMCAGSSRPFEYAFLLDALADEQRQGITIDSARVFFKSPSREYIIIDAPGHIEFLKNMLSGASRASAAVLIIDAKEGIAENSRRHGLLLSLLGIRQVVVVVNKMDLVNYSRDVFDRICGDYSLFLAELGVQPQHFIPVAAREGVNLISGSANTPWYTGKSVLEALDSFDDEQSLEDKPFAMSLQDVYKFTENNDDRRIFAGTPSTGTISAGDRVAFLPSGKTSVISTVEGFNTEQRFSAGAGEATGFTLETQVYVKPGEVMVKEGEGSIKVSDRFRANIFWLGSKPFETGREYKLKIGCAKTSVTIEKIEKLIDAQSLGKEADRKGIRRHEAATLLLKTSAPVAFDTFDANEPLGRFVIIDDYNIAGGGIILEALEKSSARKVRAYSKHEVELNRFIRKHYPHWECINIEE